MDTKTLAEKLKSAPTATSLSGLSTLSVDSSGELRKVNLLRSVEVNTIADIKSPGVYRAINAPNLPNGSILRWGVILCLNAGMDLYLLAMTHDGKVAYAFVNNGIEFKGWNMLTS